MLPPGAPAALIWPEPMALTTRFSCRVLNLSSNSRSNINAEVMEFTSSTGSKMSSVRWKKIESLQVSALPSSILQEVSASRVTLSSREGTWECQTRRPHHVRTQSEAARQDSAALKRTSGGRFGLSREKEAARVQGRRGPLLDFESITPQDVNKLQGSIASIP